VFTLFDSALNITPDTALICVSSAEYNVSEADEQDFKALEARVDAGTVSHAEWQRFRKANNGSTCGSAEDPGFFASAVLCFGGLTQ
jgi:hypothetical protein